MRNFILASALISSFASAEVVTNFEVGLYHSCLTTDLGQMKCWGSNMFGGLGTGDMVSYQTPTNVSGVQHPTDFALSSGATCAVQRGKVFCWGSNLSHELGQPIAGLNLFPAEIPGINNAVDVEMGSGHGCAILDDHTVKCWGANTFGQLGLGHFSHYALATAVPSLKDVQKLALGVSHTCALVSSGRVYCWGLNNHGQLGHAGLVSSIPLAVNVDRVTNIAAGAEHTCAQVSENSIKCWGLNKSGQLGNQSTVSSPKPVTVSHLVSSKISALESGRGNHTCVIDRGAMKCWGLNDNEQIGKDQSVAFSTVPELIESMGKVVSLEVGYKTNCFVDVHQKLSCFGNNRYGQVWHSSPVTYTKAPVSVELGSEGSGERLNVSNE